jgi:hypothetical protein
MMLRRISMVQCTFLINICCNCKGGIIDSLKKLTTRVPLVTDQLYPPKLADNWNCPCSPALRGGITRCFAKPQHGVAYPLFLKREGVKKASCCPRGTDKPDPPTAGRMVCAVPFSSQEKGVGMSCEHSDFCLTPIFPSGFDFKAQAAEDIGDQVEKQTF